MRFTNSCTLGALHLKNGFIMAPVKTAYGTPDGRVTERHLTYHANIARGGAAMVILASGMLPETELFETLKQQGKPVTLIGDADHPADIFAASQSGYRTRCLWPANNSNANTVQLSGNLFHFFAYYTSQDLF